jgi:hypothetical protein
LSKYLARRLKGLVDGVGRRRRVHDGPFNVEVPAQGKEKSVIPSALRSCFPFFPWGFPLGVSFFFFFFPLGE